MDYIFVRVISNNLRRISTKYLRGYWKGSENDRVVTIESTALEASTLTITPPTRFHLNMKLVWKVVGASFRTWTISGDRFSEMTS